MQVRLMMTDGGPHPPETLAWSTAQRVVDDFAEAAPEAAYKEVVAFREVAEKVLAAHHRLVQDAERSALKTEGSDRLASSIDTDQWIDDAVDDIIAAAREKVDGKPKWPTLTQYFARPETRQYIEDVLHMELHQTMHIERSWHADTHPDDQHAKAFHAVQRDGHALLTRHDDDLEEHGGRELISAMVLNTIPKITAKTEG
jgi:hypothetical protein